MSSNIPPEVLRVYLKHSPAIAELLRLLTKHHRRIADGFMSQSDLAALMGVSRQRVNQLITKALARGILTERPFPVQSQKAHPRRGVQ
jgi:arsenate reductase-like glutaredoxin family protein